MNEIFVGISLYLHIRHRLLQCVSNTADLLAIFCFNWMSASTSSTVDMIFYTDQSWCSHRSILHSQKTTLELFEMRLDYNAAALQQMCLFLPMDESLVSSLREKQL